MKISAVQTDIFLGAPDSNLRTLERHLVAEASRGCELIVFPECFVSGYCFGSKEEAILNAQPLNGPFTESVVNLCSHNKCSAVFGMVERDQDDIFNTAVLTGPQGIIGFYRKVHLPWLGVDRFTTPGNAPFRVFDINGVRVGMLICYDAGFPEAVRSLALDGADIVVLPTNWPPGAEQLAAHAINTRAMENSIYFLAANRIGTERGFQFIGSSRICDTTGKTLVSADHRDESVLRVSIDPDLARNKRITRVPGEHIIDRIADRRPEMYGRLCEQHSFSRPGRDNDPAVN
ncbi:MAG: carbon-nitrogen hydrolase family protein [Fuerstiella sp.]|nr:carbon-nitrogen hydrolase family protein [Fuerstiella sp.]